MAFLEFLNALIALVFAIIVIDEIFYPVITNRPLFWRFRKSRQDERLKDEIQDLEKQLEEERLRLKTQALQSELFKVQNRNLEYLLNDFEPQNQSQQDKPLNNLKGESQ